MMSVHSFIHSEQQNVMLTHCSGAHLASFWPFELRTVERQGKENRSRTKTTVVCLMLPQKQKKILSKDNRTRLPITHSVGGVLGADFAWRRTTLNINKLAERRARWRDNHQNLKNNSWSRWEASKEEIWRNERAWKYFSFSKVQRTGG